MSISEFIDKSGAQMRVFDLGRRVQKISKQDFKDYDLLNKPYPTPYLGHAWLGILTWNPKVPGQHNVWFLKLPLDEQSFIEPGHRDAFLNHWLKCIQYPDKEHGEAPCYYKPDQNRMGYFHALALKALQQPHSNFYATTRAYLSGDTGWDNWQQVGLQGLAEVVVNLDEDGNEKLVIDALANMPIEPLRAVLNYLENVHPNSALTIAINDRLAQVIAGNAESADLAAFSRALSHSQNEVQRRQLLSAILQHPKTQNIEVLAAIASRCWQDLEGDLLMAFLELLAGNDQGQNAFNAIIGDLMPLKGMREAVLGVFRDPSRSDVLTAAIEGLMKGVQQATTPH